MHTSYFERLVSYGAILEDLYRTQIKHTFQERCLDGESNSNDWIKRRQDA